MQPASDIFLGWATTLNGRQFYVRQLHDAKIKPSVETFDAEMLDAFAQACGWVLARAHAKASEVSATISGYLGSSNDAFDTAMGKFALAYADQAESDHAALKDAVRKGEIAAIKDA
jgi:DNA-binding IclR family transcriptional regulator